MPHNANDGGSIHRHEIRTQPAQSFVYCTVGSARHSLNCRENWLLIVTEAVVPFDLRQDNVGRHKP